MHIHRSEKIWLGLGAATLVIFLGIIGAAAVSDGIAPASHVQTIDPTKVAQTPPFVDPGVHRLADGSYEADIVGHIFAFTPAKISVPVGAKVTFFATSPDVVHGFFIADTDVNMMLIPGWVSSATHVFAKPGTYLLMCNEYCGVGHHFMSGTIEVR
jgi:cytochrome c oxidase subunit 2